MDSKKANCVLAYSGSLDAWQPNTGKSFMQKVLSWFITYKHSSVDKSTRSAYYLIHAVAKLKNQKLIQVGDLSIQIWGSIHPLNIEQAKSENVLEFFEFGTYLSKKESLQKLHQADALFLPLEKSASDTHRTLFIPGKLFEYLRADKIIFALAEDSDCKDILRKSGLAICSAPDDVDEIASNLYKLLKAEIKKQDLKIDYEYIQSFSMENKTAELSKVFDSLSVK